ncbi:MAG TPA: CPBP family intramembrane glutamic endopeptidase [Candidatus Sulfotelmatobacter sp.]|nr:CPBP family intramembrane glutamic endopeptidase [Candidatus Sulfotelmatobacter sp.]
MTARSASNHEAIIKRRPVVTYFALTFTISWIGALVVAAPQLIRHQPLSKMTGILMFPVMLLGPSFAGIVLTRFVDGKSGLRSLFSRMSLAVPAVWYAALLIPPVLILTVLLFLERFVSPIYAPNHFLVGMLFGVPAGFLEEIGWMGYAFPKMRSESNGLAPGILLGLLWAVWHLPVINYLGTATPHGAYWLPFFLAFTLAMVAMRVLIVWIYTNTKSVLLTQLMHVSSTGSLVIFSAPRVTALQEVLWYALYGTVLWVAVAIVVKIFGRQLGQQRG